ncbi:hypothetical protein QOZ80_6BG0493140 [Eleusine coracana subsp. coracana]|nr:hypothetical protein QOZ80_6BG0493140 [Eleusine coracana subsp. coracana]
MRLTYYQRLSEAEGGARAAARAWAWAALRRAAGRVARLYAARQRRWAARTLCLWGGRRRRVAGARARGYEYDSASYERNFDDGEWKDEEGVSWHARSSFAASSRLQFAAV